MGFSRLEYPYTGGSQDFSAQFALGYLDQSQVKAYVDGEVDGLGAPVPRPFTWVDSETINITDPIPNPSTVRIERTVNKDELIINLDSNGSVTRVTVVNAFRQLMMNIHELLDGRVDQFTDIQQIQDLATQVNASALIIDASIAASAASETAAALSEVAAAASEAKAQQWADEDEDVFVETGMYSAKHYAAKAATFDPAIYFKLANAFSELDDTTKRSNARNNLGLGSAAVEDTSFFVEQTDKADQTESETGTNNTKWMTPLRVLQSIVKWFIGHNQTWQNVLASRTHATTYQNTTGRPIMVMISKSGGGSNDIELDGVAHARLSDVSGTVATVAFIVPDGSTYRIQGGSGISITYWAELR